MGAAVHEIIPDYNEEGYPLKKQILCTSAIALGCAMAAPVSAQDWNLDWGGYMSSHLAYVDTGGAIGNAAGVDFDGVSSSSLVKFTSHPASLWTMA